MRHLVDTLRHRRLWLIGLVVAGFFVPAALAADGVPAGAQGRGELAFQPSPQLREMVRGSQPVIDVADRIGGTLHQSTVAVGDAAPEDGTLALRPVVLLFRDGRPVEEGSFRGSANRFGLADAPGGLVVTGIGPRGIDSTWMVEPLVIRFDETDPAAY